MVFTTWVKSLPACFQHRLEIRHCPGGLFRYPSADQLSVGRIERDLTRGEEEAVGDQRLAVGADGLGGPAVATISIGIRTDPRWFRRAYPDRFGGRRLGQARHGHDVSGQRHHEAGARRGIHIPDGEPEAGRAARAWSDRRRTSTGSWRCRPASCPRPIASNWAMFFSAAAA